ncbi:putative transcriptional regulatory protein [Golovinomyces cichoracearum]|uniref:Putative transcriptional regulatory protein n=1 Tax=Golovinomyces cichoracearum TaxID=62708 RepID=A0A420ITV0_9PEZI|nr:putative transcriptional regulatory protein [Golovinomyces cichoracearum]
MQSYPSPSAAAANNGCPFYTSGNNQNSSLQNPDELQLSAQLTTNIAPMMGVAPNGSMSESQVSRGQSRGNLVHQFDNEHDQHAHLQQSPGSLDQLGGHYGTRDGSLAPRKRTKVSRACDECRRKKIRCDATTDQNDVHCSNCKRVGARCQFSRVPMKRGPSKGYIKELADRLHTLEGAMHSGEMTHQFVPQHENSLQRRDSENYSPPPSIDSFSRKRRISATTDFGPYLAQKPLASWNSVPQDASRHLAQTSSGLVSPQTAPSGTNAFQEATNSPTSLQTAIWRNEPAQFRHLSDAVEDLANHQVSLKRDFEIENTILDAYYKLIQPTYCLLPFNKDKIPTQLAHCPAPLNDAMQEAMSIAVNSFQKDNPSPAIDTVNARRAMQYILVSSLEDTTSRHLRVNLVFLQTMLLFAIAVENNALHHPKILGSFSHSVWISSTISLAYAIKLFRLKPKKLKDTNIDADENVARRLWWSMYIMDRWNSAGTSSPVLIPDTASVLYPDDLPLLGDALWNLARLSTILGHLSTINTVSNTLPPLSVPLASAYGATVKGELERVRENLLSNDCHPLVLMAYWHLRILVELQLVDSEPNDLIDIAVKAINHLSHNFDFDSPLKYHFILLIILTLIDLLDYEMTRPQSEIQIEIILEKKLISADWEAVVQAMLTKRKNISTNTLSQIHSTDVDHNIEIDNLVRLADLATAAGAKRESGMSTGNAETLTTTSPFRYYNWLRQQVRNGFLNVLKQELAQG